MNISRHKFLNLVFITNFLLFSFISTSILKSEELKVGAILPFSGELSYFGKAFQQVFSMGVKNSSQISKIYYEDDKSGNRKEALSGLRKLISKNKINLVLVTGYPIAVVLDSIVKSNNLISFSTWDSNNELLKLKSNTYGFGWSNEKNK